MSRASGFTLIELMIVIAVILIIAALSIPSMIEANISANETSAVASIRAINVAEITYQATYGGYADSLANLGGGDPCKKSAETACLLDDSLAGGTKAGYHFSATGGNAASGGNTSYVAAAAPEVFDRTGRRLFCSTEKNVVRADGNATGTTTLPDAGQCTSFAALGKKQSMQ